MSEFDNQNYHQKQITANSFQQLLHGSQIMDAISHYNHQQTEQLQQTNHNPAFTR